MKEVGDEVNFSHVVDKHQTFLQVDTNIFDGCGQACLNSQSDFRIRKAIIAKKGAMDCL